METFVRDDSEDIYFGADPEPYLFEPEYTENGSYLAGDYFQALRNIIAMLNFISLPATLHTN